MTKKHWKDDGVPFREAFVRAEDEYSRPAEYLEYRGYGGSVMKPADDFEATLKVLEQERGQSAARVVFQEVVFGTIYRMFLGDFVEMVKTRKPITLGVYDGTWEFVKKGQNYAVRLK